MKTIAFLLAFCPAVALADYPTTTPCTSNGQTLTISRAPTQAELAAEPDPKSFPPPPVLQMMVDYVACDGTSWSLTRTMKQYRGVPTPTFIQKQ